MADFKFLGINWGGKSTTTTLDEKVVVKDDMRPENRTYNGTWGQAYVVPYDGEKDFGEIGPVLDYRPQYTMLRLRSWQAYLESEIARTVINKYITWVIGKGLRIQANPSESIISRSDSAFKAEEFNDQIEESFSVWAESKDASLSGMETLGTLARDCYKNAMIGGDCLVLLRVVKKQVKVQIIDGAHVGSPLFNEGVKKGNRIYNGVEINAKGEHVAYHVKDGDNNYKRYLSKSPSTGLTMAFLVYGSKHRLDNHRGMPVIATSLETMKKIERYKEAAVGSAEERQKIAYSIEHQVFSDGENPLADRVAAAFDVGNSNDSAIPVDENGVILENHVASTTNKQAINMPRGAQLKMHESKNEMFFGEFYGTNADIVCSSVEIPPNVAFSVYNNSFSASRTATKDWEHTLDIRRNDFTLQFYQHIYNLFLHLDVLIQDIQAPGYINAFFDKNRKLLNAYRRVRFTGDNFPHIDPHKEVKAEREKLGPLAANIPLTTVEAATEALNGGDSRSNMEQFSKEIDSAKDLNLSPEPTKTDPPLES